MPGASGMSSADGRPQEATRGNASIASDSIGEFAQHLASRKHIADILGLQPGLELCDSPNALQKTWELTELSGNDFADEVASFYRLARVSLPQLLAASALVNHFSPRFLREMVVFPYQTAGGQFRLAVGD